MLPVIRIGPAIIQSSVLALIIALWLGASIAERVCKRRGLDGGEVWNVTALGVAATLVLARLIFVLQNIPIYAGDPVGIFSLTPGALSLDYGIVFGLLAVYGYIQRRHIPLARFADAVAPGALIAIAIIAFGQFLSGDGYGTTTTLFIGVPMWGETRHAVQVYDAVLAVIGAYIVWRMTYAPIEHDGAIALNALAWYGFVRLFIDAFRADAALLPGGYRVTQVLAWLALLGALWGMARLEMRQARKTQTSKE